MQSSPSSEALSNQSGPGLIARCIRSIIIVLINTLPPRMTVNYLRSFGQDQPDEWLGTFGPDLAQAKEHEPVAIPVAGFPDAALTLFTPKTADPQVRPLVLWIHGGGWIGGSAARIARHT